MPKDYLSQTQFSIEEPILDGQAKMPEEEKKVEPDQLDKQAALKKKRLYFILAAVGSGLIIVGIIVLFGMSLSSTPQITQAPSPTPTPVVVEPDLGLREQIDVLVDEVNQYEKPSRSLVFPSVEADIRVPEPR